MPCAEVWTWRKHNIPDLIFQDLTLYPLYPDTLLIALTARRHEATVVTANLSYFDLLAWELRIHTLAARAQPPRACLLKETTCPITFLVTTLGRIAC